SSSSPESASSRSGIRHGELFGRGVAVQAHPHAPARRDQQPLTLASLANALLLLGAQVGALVDDLAQLAVFHLAVPAVGRIALDGAADRCVEPIRYALRQHVQ